MRLSTLLVPVMLLICQIKGSAQSGPQPPCGNEPVPAWPSLDEAAVAKIWSRADLGHDWKPPACTGWTQPGFTTLVTTAARFRYTAGADGLLRHIGAINELAGMRYWSTTHRQWQTLITDAWAVTGPQGVRRGAFDPTELKAGSSVYFDQTDNLTGKAIYRMHIAEATADRLVFSVENIGTMRYFMVPIFHAGEMQSIYFLDRESESTWRFYSMVRTGLNASGLVATNEASAINRAVAFYRALVGIPTDREPPAAR